MAKALGYHRPRKKIFKAKTMQGVMRLCVWVSAIFVAISNSELKISSCRERATEFFEPQNHKIHFWQNIYSSKYVFHFSARMKLLQRKHTECLVHSAFTILCTVFVDLSSLCLHYVLCYVLCFFFCSGTGAGSKEDIH